MSLRDEIRYWMSLPFRRMREELERRAAERREVVFASEQAETENLFRWRRGEPGARKPAPDASWRLLREPVHGRERRSFDRDGLQIRYNDAGRLMPHGRPYDPLYNRGDDLDSSWR